MRKFVAEHPVWFVVIVSVFMVLLGFVIQFAATMGLPEVTLPIVGSLVGVIVPVALIAWLGWWRSSGFTGDTLNHRVLWLPLLAALIPIIVFGTVVNENRIVVFFLVAMLLTAIGEEALSRGLFVRALLPLGKWYAVLIPSVLFGVGHITQFLFQGMPLAENLLQITHNIFYGVMYGAARLRVKSLWPLIVLHMVGNVNFILAGVAGPNAINEPPAPVFIGLWVVEIVYAVLILRKPIAVSVTDDESVAEGARVPALETA